MMTAAVVAVLAVAVLVAETLVEATLAVATLVAAVLGEIFKSSAHPLLILILLSIQG